MSFFKRFVKKSSAPKSHRGPQQSGIVVKPVAAPVKVKPVAVNLNQASSEAKEIIVEAKDQAFEIKKQADQVAQKIINEAQNLRDKARSDGAEIERRLGAIEQREKSATVQEKHLADQLQEITSTKEKQLKKLESISKLSPDEAKSLILKMYQKRMTRDVADIVREAEDQAKAQAEEKARDILIESMRHGATDYVAEYTVSLVKVADDEMKGRVIGREGRNIRTFEKVTGVEVDLDEPGVIRLSCFDTVRREIARLTLEKLLSDGRIQPARIEEVHRQVTQDINRIMRQEGEKLCHAVKVFNLPIEVMDMLGRFKYRFSYGQSMILHTLEETKIGIKLAHETGADVNIVRLGCLLHDIGKVIQDEEGTHVELGVKFLRKYRIPEAVVNCVAEHHEDKPFSSVESMLVYTADAISGSRPGARYEDHEGYLKRMTQLEDIANSFDGVKEAFALQAGREVRVIVNPDSLSDDQSVKLASDIRDKIKSEVKDFPGQIKVNVIREARFEATA